MLSIHGTSQRGVLSIRLICALMRTMIQNTGDVLRIDFHFHPNFTYTNLYFSKRRAGLIWDKFIEHELDAVVVSEHNFRHAAHSYRLLECFRPKGAKTALIPGVEVITKEGIDIVVFGKKPFHVYGLKELLAPGLLTIEELVNIIKNNSQLHGIVVHPYMLGATGILTCGEEKTRYAIESLGFVEGHNCAFGAFEKTFDDTVFQKIFKNTFTQVKCIKHLPYEWAKCGAVVTGGSDAHHPWEIGGHIAIAARKDQNLDYIFEIITTRSGTFIERYKIYRTELLRSIFTSFREHLIKQYHCAKCRRLHEYQKINSKS